MRYVLASASPRRKELLRQIGLEFETLPACGDEKTSFTKPEDIVMDLARKKAGEVAKSRGRAAEPEVIIGADTTVAVFDQILGKPKDEEDAYRMISMLQGKRHKVYTGVCLLLRGGDKDREHSFYEETEVTMHPVSEEERRFYIGTGEPFDKAGGYAVQGKSAVFIKEIQGDYNNVVGLPLARIYQELRGLGITIYSDKGENENGNI